MLMTLEERNQLESSVDVAVDAISTHIREELDNLVLGVADILMEDGLDRQDAFKGALAAVEDIAQWPTPRCPELDGLVEDARIYAELSARKREAVSYTEAE